MRLGSFRADAADDCSFGQLEQFGKHDEREDEDAEEYQQVYASLCGSAGMVIMRIGLGRAQAFLFALTCGDLCGGDGRCGRIAVALDGL